MKAKSQIVSVLIIFLALQLSAQNRIDEIDKLVGYCQENGMFNGNILIAENGEIIYHKSIGTTDFENSKPLNINTSFCLGSISKQFTAMGIMVLEEMDKLNYSDTLGEIFPELPEYLHKITIKNLLQHTSGLKRTHYQNHDGLMNDEIFQILMKTEGDKLMFEPGTDLSYSNTAYILLAIIIEKVSGKTYEEFLQEYVWQPLGMTHTFVMSQDDYGRQDIAIGYDGFGNKDDFNVLTYGTNGVYSTTEDLFRWSQSMSTNKIIPLASKEVSYQPATSTSGEILDLSMRDNIFSYGFGQYIYRDSLEGIIGHSGAFGGFYNILMKDLESNRDVVVLTNNGRLLPIFEFGNAIQNILRGESYEMPKVSIDLAIRRKYYNNIDEGIKYYHKLKKESPNKYKFDDEWELNRLGYALLADERINDAIKIFKLLISEFPNSVNPHDSLGEAYFNSKQYDLAIKSYQKALAINENYDDAPHAKEMIKKSKEKLTTTKYKR